MPRKAEGRAMAQGGETGIEALIEALPETAGSALYGMIDVLAATGSLWRALIGEPAATPLIRPRIVAMSLDRFTCGNRIPVQPDLAVDDDPRAPIVILPELWLDPDDTMADRYPEIQARVSARTAPSTRPTPVRCSWPRRAS